uniref:pre-rRNA processing protein FTSJ3 n=2 Tax=Malurus TaxID=55806 RepID=A0A8C5U7L6_9PASS
MGKKSKVGKSRRDKFYHLAKETGFRSRSSFKLLQLNRKFQFLQKARALLDLCAAPGGWLQVASKFMPVSSLIIGVDLVPIKPIPNVVTLQEDITTEKCRQALRKELQTWKVDVVLNDGAPNVGASWVHDAYSQATLTLMALKLACEFLCKGGWFITKVFRSRDYQPLLWIFQQFFQKVQATKPQASRNESAEIFVVCQGYQAPDKIDSKFFDPKYAFKDVEVPTKSVSELVSKKKPKAEGYAEGDTTLYHRFTLMDFLKAPNPVDFLSKANEITLGDGELENHSSTTEELRQCCRDIRVLGRKELRALLNWRTKLRRFLAKKLKEQAKELDINLSSGEEEEGREEEKKEKMEAKAAAAEEAKEEEEVELALAELKAKELAEKKKKILKEQWKQRERVELKMDLPGVSIADDGDTAMFSLRCVREGLTARDVEHYRRDRVMSPPMRAGIGSVIVFEALFQHKWVLMVCPGSKAASRNLWTSPSSPSHRGATCGLSSPSHGVPSPLCQHSRLASSAPDTCALPPASSSSSASILSQCRPKSILASSPGTEGQPSGTRPGVRESGPVPGRDLREVGSSPREGERCSLALGPQPGQALPCPPVKRALDAEGLALGSVIATSKKARRDLIDDSFNRYSYNEEEGELPEWFTEEERQHRRRQLPVDKQTVEAYRQRWREINARPIKKVAEAKARKKRRMLKKLEQMKKKAEAVVSTVDISEREKVAQLRRIYKKAGLAKEKRQVTYLVAKKGVGPRVRRPPGVKGQFKVVDSRLKKDVRAQKRKEQKKKRHK